ncbi:hypothetical protein CDL15_Pgr005065 [Punica granatum]|uniref:Uncharacterized protein n=1 Tax=Punica granatum TaxID=22663 RepID=A0A218XZN8_PUNGR|nr:hypothetical protein CDL15_Pgr005065 [Punica granatum]
MIGAKLSASDAYLHFCVFEVGVKPLLRWSGCETQLQWSEANAAPRILIRRRLTLLLERLHFVVCRVCYWAIMLSLAMPRPCDEGFCLAGCRVLKDSRSGVERLRILSGRESESAVALACLWYL